VTGSKQTGGIFPAAAHRPRISRGFDRYLYRPVPAARDVANGPVEYKESKPPKRRPHRELPFMTPKQTVSRRRALKLGTAAAALPLVHIRTAGAAGKLSLALWDHWVPAGGPAMRKLVQEWADKNKVDVQLDFLTAIGNKINITMAAEAQSKTGHDVYAFDSWTVQQYGDTLTPMDNIMKDFTAKYGKIGRAYEYLGVSKGQWKAIPVAWGSAPLTPCARISMMQKYAGIDVRKWFPNAPAT